MCVCRAPRLLALCFREAFPLPTSLCLLVSQVYYIRIHNVCTFTFIPTYELRATATFTWGLFGEARGGGEGGEGELVFLIDTATGPSHFH